VVGGGQCELVAEDAGALDSFGGGELALAKTMPGACEMGNQLPTLARMISQVLAPGPTETYHEFRWTSEMNWTDFDCLAGASAHGSRIRCCFALGSNGDRRKAITASTFIRSTGCASDSIGGIRSFRRT